MKRLLCSLVLFWCSVDSYAQPGKIDMTDQWLEFDVWVHADGRYGQLVLRRARLEGDPGRKWAGIKLAIPVQMSEVHVSKVVLIKKSGRRIEGTANIIDHPGDGGHTREITMTIPGAEKGDMVEYLLSYTTLAVAGKYLSYHQFIPKNVYVGDAELRIHIPKGVDVQMHSQGYDDTSWTTTRTGKTYRVRYSNRNPQVVRADAANIVAASPAVLMSTAPGYEALGRALGAEFKRLGAPSANVRQLAKTIAGKASSKEEAARALYAWVKANIRYSDKNIYADGVTPRTPDATLASKNGDCKDMALLLSTLLSVAGVEHALGFINTGNEFTLPKVVVGNVFNHVIVYLPAGQRYLDATSSYSSFDVPPAYVYGKPMLLLGDGARVHQVPALRQPAQVVTTTVVEMNEKGVIVGTSLVDAAGVAIPGARRMEEALNRGAKEALPRALFNQGIAQAQGRFEFSFDDKKGVHKSALHFTGMGGVGGRERATIKPEGYFKHDYALTRFVNHYRDPQTTSAFVCQPSVLHDRLRIRLPNAGYVATLPRAVEIRRGTLVYRASYAQQQNVIDVVRSLENVQAPSVCSPGEYANYHAMAREIGKDLAAVIEVQQKR